ncbi:MAG: hypothetical protein ABIP51_17445 [Bacteroidia bacterium]
MNKYLYSLFLCVLVTVVSAQNRTKYFEMDYRGKKIDNSLYNTIKFIDSREDTSNMGIVRTGALNKEAFVKINGSFSDQFSDLLLKITGEAPQQKELLFQLRRLKFVEKTDESHEYGYCFFRANLFASSNNAYNLISVVDTFIIVESKDVTNSIIEETNKAITDFLKDALTKKINTASILSLNEIVKIDSIEKLKIKVYNVSEYTNGIYRTFESFKAQVPDYNLFSITFEDGEISGIKAKNKKEKIKNIKSDDVYAIVNNGKPYVSAKFGFYPLVKNNNDFYFIADDKLHFIKGQIATSNSIFSSTEYVYSPMPVTSMFEIKIDHVNGKFMRVREVKN